MTSLDDGSNHVLSVTIQYAPGDYGMTKLVIISSMYVLVNNTPYQYAVIKGSCDESRCVRWDRRALRRFFSHTPPSSTIGPMEASDLFSSSRTTVSIRSGVRA